MEAEEARREQDEEDRAATRAAEAARAPQPVAIGIGPAPAEDMPAEDMPAEGAMGEPEPIALGTEAPPSGPAAETADIAEPDAPPAFADAPAEPALDFASEASLPEIPPAPDSVDIPSAEDRQPGEAMPLAIAEDRREGEPFGESEEAAAEEPPPETIGGEHDTTDEPRARRAPNRFFRNYKIQEVIHRRQILLVQVEKEERGTKGAALTTYISLAGRYSVLMPNSPRGGGVSRKITAPNDRRRLKEVMAELDLPEGMGLIVRTAGANRPKPEIRRDAEYLLRLWDDIRERTLRSVAPALIHEEASLIKRAIRDVYSRDIDEIAVDGEEGWRAAREFMRMLMPAQASKVQLWRDPNAPSGIAGQPLFARHGVEAQLDAMLSPNVQLRSGGYLVINQAEALVAIDVNSGRATRERGIEETALRTNLEAAEEVARQLRLRDLAGLIVIDFIDMESRKHNGMVEKRLKDALKSDRARIQIGHISHFGLLEMSRQRLRPSLAETSQVVCPHCGGSGHLRSTESAAIHVLRGIEEEGGKRRAAEIVVHVALPIALYILNHKRDRLGEIESRHGMRVAFAGDDTLIAPEIRIERVRPFVPSDAPAAMTPETGRAYAPPPPLPT
ncbi:MAG: ribonuclease E/G, partial [Rhodospirillales bacterium]|nr:ribonuclease E/G [Rhodospirillales bacterium]